METNRFEKFGIRKADILLPKETIDLEKWATIACDQFTSEREYWEKVDRYVGESPSTLRMILPECYINDSDKERRIESIDSTMESYLKNGIFREYKDSFILVKRSFGSKCRYGLMVLIDLECYDYSKTSRSLVRATEGTILERIPPRLEIRKNAPMELPHIVVLISDEKRNIIEPLINSDSRKIYETDLMMDGGHIEGFLVGDKGEDIIYDGLENLYENLDKDNPLLYAMGDGNHSLATAKAMWEETKRSLGKKEKEDNPMRYALVEIENIFDEGIEFEPIHRVFFNYEKENLITYVSKLFRSVWLEKVSGRDELIKRINEGKNLRLGLAQNENLYILELTGGDKISAATLIQDVIDTSGVMVDYIHGVDSTIKIANSADNLGIIMPDISKNTFFDTIIREGSFPRKTFSIGKSVEKRYYMEARLIREIN